MNIIAVTATILVLALGAVSLVREGGYEFDLRRKAKRPVLGDRRAH
jgi:hypothetical protein